jgi:hypothetical protein
MAARRCMGRECGPAYDLGRERSLNTVTIAVAGAPGVAGLSKALGHYQERPGGGPDMSRIAALLSVLVISCPVLHHGRANMPSAATRFVPNRCIVFLREPPVASRYARRNEMDTSAVRNYRAQIPGQPVKSGGRTGRKEHSLDGIGGHTAKRGLRRGHAGPRGAVGRAAGRR